MYRYSRCRYRRCRYIRYLGYVLVITGVKLWMIKPNFRLHFFYCPSSLDFWFVTYN